MRRALFLTVLLAFTGGCATDTPLFGGGNTTWTDVRCEEDMPCWDCASMGNGICGLTPSEDAAERAESTTDNGQRQPVGAGYMRPAL